MLEPSARHPSTPRPAATPNRLGRWSESPWFWAVAFLNAALIGLALIAPKYRQREAMLERRYEVRRDSALRRAAGQQFVESSGAEADPKAQDRPLLVPLGPLAVALAAIDVAAIALFLRRRRSGPAANPDPLSPGGT